MKKALLTAAAIATISTSAMAVTPNDKQNITKALNQAGLESVWAQDISLWIKKPSSINNKMELESVGHAICDATRGAGFYVITFWQSLNGHGKITKIKCS